MTQGTLKVVGAFLGLSRARSDARRYPSIDPLDSWSKYRGIIEPDKVARMHNLLVQGNEVRQMMTVVGEEGTSTEDYTLALKADFFDNCYLQQNAFDDVDGATPAERQQSVFDKVLEVAELDLERSARPRSANPWSASRTCSAIGITRRPAARNTTAGWPKSSSLSPAKDDPSNLALESRAGLLT